VTTPSRTPISPSAVVTPRLCALSPELKGSEMAEARCANPECGRLFYKRMRQHRFCTRVCRERAKALSPRSKRYSYSHEELRRKLAPQVAAGGIACARCGGPIDPGDPWDLDHTEDGTGYLGPSHASCNRATAVPTGYEDDPAKASSSVRRTIPAVSRADGPELGSCGDDCRPVGHQG
jgi:hypothetical protein